jgi:hypothetical protein
MSATAFVELERLTHVATLGVRFWDRPTASVVSDGLRLTHVESGRTALPNRFGVFVVRGLPGMREAEDGAGDEAYWASPPGLGVRTFELVDTFGRFHDVRFDAELPARGLFAEDCGLGTSPPDAVPASVPLFSLPSRLAPAGTAIVRAELVDALTGEPAAWAVLEVSAPGVDTARGIADRLGRVLVLLPYPEPPWQSGSPPPGSRPLSAQTWPVELDVRYSPAAASPPLPGPEDAEPPDLCSTLQQLPAGLSSATLPAVPITSDELVFGRELVLSRGERRILLVTPAA